jgi:hypothetical protein
MVLLVFGPSYELTRLIRSSIFNLSFVFLLYATHSSIGQEEGPAFYVGPILGSLFVTAFSVAMFLFGQNTLSVVSNTLFSVLIFSYVGIIQIWNHRRHKHEKSTFVNAHLMTGYAGLLTAAIWMVQAIIWTLSGIQDEMQILGPVIPGLLYGALIFTSYSYFFLIIHEEQNLTHQLAQETLSARTTLYLGEFQRRILTFSRSKTTQAVQILQAAQLQSNIRGHVYEAIKQVERFYAIHNIQNQLLAGNMNHLSIISTADYFKLIDDHLNNVTENIVTVTPKRDQRVKVSSRYLFWILYTLIEHLDRHLAKQNIRPPVFVPIEIEFQTINPKQIQIQVALSSVHIESENKEIFHPDTLKLEEASMTSDFVSTFQDGEIVSVEIVADSTEIKVNLNGSII